MSKIKLGVSYNVFDGFELLEDSISQIREFVDYISIVYQDKSNWGNDAHPLQKVVIDKLVENGLVDEIIPYTVNRTIDPKQNEREKRNIGLNMSRDRNCTHHMSMDCDEFYIKADFKRYVEWIKDNPNKAAYSELLNYMKYPNLRYVINNKTKVSLFAPIDTNTKFIHNFKIPYLVDPSRIMNDRNVILFDKNFISMHHMTTIRKDMTTKLNNASKRVNKTKQQIDNFLEIFNNLDINDESTYDAFPKELFKVEQLFSLENFYKLDM